MLKIPILKRGRKPCRRYIYALEAALNADGCSGASEFYHDCCIIHDLGYRLGINVYGQIITRYQADAAFKECMQAKSIFGVLSLMAWWRYAAVRWFGAKHYTHERPDFYTYFF